MYVYAYVYTLHCTVHYLLYSRYLWCMYKIVHTVHACLRRTNPKSPMRYTTYGTCPIRWTVPPMYRILCASVTNIVRWFKRLCQHRTLLYLKHISINPCLVSHRLSGPPRASALPSTYPIVYTVQHTTVLYNTRAVDMYDMIFIHPLGTFGVTTTGLTQKFKLIDPDPTMYCGTSRHQKGGGSQHRPNSSAGQTQTATPPKHNHLSHQLLLCLIVCIRKYSAPYRTSESLNY